MTLKKRLFTLLVAVTMLLPTAGVAANSYGIPDKIQDSNILHCFDWTFNDIIKELPNIAAAGFGAIQVSPVQGNAATNAEWFYAYMPYDFKFKANGNGSRSQLQELCTKASEYGIKIVVDVVANHINQAAGYHDTWWDSNGRIRWNGWVNYGDRYSITHNQLGEYGDVNSEDAQVQARCKEFLNDLKSIGVKGIRWDAAKHIGLPSEGCAFWSQMASVAGLWHYGEILDGPGGDKYKLLKEYTNYIGVTDSEYSKWTLDQVQNGQVPSGGGSWTANGVKSDAVVYWGESHDDYSNDGQYGKNTANISQDKIDRAYAICACRKGETALYFSRPSATSRNAIKMGQKGSTHFTSKHIAEVNKFRNAMVGTDDYYSQSNGVACITRKGGGAVIVIGAGGSRNVSVTNGGGYVPAGTYTDRVSGSTFTVTSSTISGQVGATGIAVIYGTVTKDASVTFTPNGGSFVNTVSVTATAVNATSAWYQIGSGTKTTLTGTATFTLGANMAVGDKVTVSWGATGESGTKSGSVTFTKTEKPVITGSYAYLDNTSNWSNPTVWAWNDADNCCANGSWPGDAMTREGDKWIWKAPEGKTPTQIIFSDGGNNQTADLAFVNGAIYKCDGTYTENGGGNDEPGPGPGPDPNQGDMPSALYILGNIQGACWNTAAGKVMHKSGNTFLADNVVFEAAAGESHCYFNLTDALAADWDELNMIANRYGASGEGDEISVNGSPRTIIKYANNVDASACKSWKVVPGTYTVTADFKANAIKVSDGSGVAVLIDDAAGDALWYTLQGVRVERPTQGIYIRVANGRTAKVRL